MKSHFALRIGATILLVALLNVPGDPAGTATAAETSAPAGPRVAATPLAEWTLLVYGHADHNLTPSLIIDLEEMETVGSAPGFNIVVQADFDGNAGPERLRGLPEEFHGGVTRFRVQADNDRDRITSPSVGRLPESDNMDSPNTLAEFIRWGVRAYPARRYGFVFWNHGGQWTGFGGDSQDGAVEPNARGVLSTRQIRDTLQAVGPGLGVAKWDFIGFDTCLMGGVEVLADFVGLTDVFIACPEIDYGDGWDYGATFGYLKANRGVTAHEFGRRETEHWREHHFQPRNQDDLALAAHAAYDLTKFAEVQAKLFAFGTSIKAAQGAHGLLLARLRNDTTGYWIIGQNEFGKPTRFVDLGEFASRVAREAVVGGALTESAAALVQSIEAMVLGRVLGTTKQNALALSIFYPVTGVQQDAAYEAIGLTRAPGATWLDYLRAVATESNGDQAPPVITPGPPPSGSTDVVFSTPTPPGVPAVTPRQVDLQVASPDSARLSAAITLNPLPNVFLYLTEIVGSSIPGAGDYRILWNGGLPVLTGRDPAVAPYLGAFYDPYGSGLLLSVAEYIIPDFFDPDLSEVFYVMIVSAVDANGVGKVLSVLDAESDDLAPEPLEVYPGDFLRPVYFAQTRNGPDPDLWPVDPVPADHAVEIPDNGLDGLKVQFLPVPQGTYRMEVSVSDLFDNESQVAVFDVNVGGPTGGQPPQIITPPQSQTVVVGSTATFHVVATGTAPLNYQWHFNGVRLHGATEATLTLSNVDAAKAGVYTVVVSGPGGSVTSVEARLAVTGGSGGDRPKLEITSANTGGNFSFKFNGTAGVNYIVDSSSDLQAWVEVSRGAPVNGTFTYTHANTAGSSSMYFRARQAQ